MKIVQAQGKKLMLFKMNMADGDQTVRMVVVMGILGKEVHRVNCIRPESLDIPFWSGVCGDKILEVFGVSLRP